ncbi:Hypothetical_protein [Hexamita inflata]|uniref:Hypothetical_protein n=1 Tax=Hexamita inflata TaxID=28002 RepID=A0AA86UEP7_9EUKA|nr:Hypothetical protein HINF_LOCUS42840 [Hexamita inflata]CAI9956125.1 Hypothetical protein HINF_LOCUS43770 [Hexamita inflata]
MISFQYIQKLTYYLFSVLCGADTTYGINGWVYPAFVSALISQASSISFLPFLTFSESSLVHLVTSSTLLCQLSIHQLLRVDFSSEYEHLIIFLSQIGTLTDITLTNIILT